MKTDVKYFAQFIAAAIWADGDFQETEKCMLREIQLGFDLPIADVEYILAEYNSLSEEQVSDSLIEAAKNVDPSERMMILDIVLQFIISDGVLSVNEVSNYYSLASILGVTEDEADQLLDETIETYGDIVIENEE